MARACTGIKFVQPARAAAWRRRSGRVSRGSSANGAGLPKGGDTVASVMGSRLVCWSRGHYRRDGRKRGCGRVGEWGKGRVWVCGYVGEWVSYTKWRNWPLREWPLRDTAKTQKEMAP